MDRTTENFRAIGEALFGPTWQTALAIALMPDHNQKSAIRSVQRWAADGPPDRVWGELAKLCATRAKVLLAIVALEDIRLYHETVRSIAA